MTNGPKISVKTAWHCNCFSHFVSLFCFHITIFPKSMYTSNILAKHRSLLLFAAVFFNLFAAGEPSANVCVAYGTLCNDPSVYIATIV